MRGRLDADAKKGPANRAARDSTEQTARRSESGSEEEEEAAAVVSLRRERRNHSPWNRPVRSQCKRPALAPPPEECTKEKERGRRPPRRRYQRLTGRGTQQHPALPGVRSEGTTANPEDASDKPDSAPPPATTG